MERIVISPRPNWKTQVESIGFSFHTMFNKICWVENAAYHFGIREIEEIEKATNEMEKLCLELVDHVVSHHRYNELHIPEYAWSLIELSWKNRDKSLYGRYDFSYNGIQPPKLLEYNADTPVCLLEAGLVQKQWLEQVRPGGYQFNRIHERLVETWPIFCSKQIHLAGLSEFEEDFGLISYLADTITQAGLSAKILHIDKINWNGCEFLDEDNQVISSLYKLYPWEWMIKEVFSRVQQSNTQMIEPAWKMILSNKGALVLLWELFPGHPNLLPAYFDQKRLSGDYVKKPLLGREGENISLHLDKGVIATEGHYGVGSFMYQKAHLLPNFKGHYPVIGSWIIAGNSAGIIIREDETPITNGLSPAVPHFFD